MVDEAYRRELMAIVDATTAAVAAAKRPPRPAPKDPSIARYRPGAAKASMIAMLRREGKLK